MARRGDLNLTFKVTHALTDPAVTAHLTMSEKLEASRVARNLQRATDRAEDTDAIVEDELDEFGTLIALLKGPVVAVAGVDSDQSSSVPAINRPGSRSRH